jgi:hypothetical protein
MRQKTYKNQYSAYKLDVLRSVTMMAAFVWQSRAGAAESLIWLEPKRSGSSTAKIKFSRKFSQKFDTFAKIFSQKRKLNFAKTFAKKNRKLSSPP